MDESVHKGQENVPQEQRSRELVEEERKKAGVFWPHQESNKISDMKGK